MTYPRDTAGTPLPVTVINRPIVIDDDVDAFVVKVAGPTMVWMETWTMDAIREFAAAGMPIGLTEGSID